MHDHTKRGKRFCPLMKEICNQGWTPSMGKDADGLPLIGICASWQPVTAYDVKKNTTEEIHDCSLFGWGPDLLTSISQEVFQGAASSDKVASEVAKFHATSLGVMNEDAQARLAAVNPRLLPSLPPENDAHNGNGKKLLSGGS